MWTDISGLFTYCSPSTPKFIFYYLPLPKHEQRRCRQEYSKFTGTSEFMGNLLRKRLIFIEEADTVTTYQYEWPSDETMQDHLMVRFPDELVLEVGASILGYRCTKDEDVSVFVEQVISGLEAVTA